MARIRSVKPEFWSDPVMAQLSHSARLLYIGLWGYCDDEGRGQYLPKQIEGFVFPREDLMNVSGGIHELLSELEKAGRIVVYEADGDRFFYIPTWHEHQKPQHPQKSKLPAPDQGKRISHETLMNGSGDSHETLTPVEGEGEGGGEVVVEGASLHTRRRDEMSELPIEVFAQIAVHTRAVRTLRKSRRWPEYGAVLAGWTDELDASGLAEAIDVYCELAADGYADTPNLLEAACHKIAIRHHGGKPLTDEEWEAIARGEA